MKKQTIKRKLDKEIKKWIEIKSKFGNCSKQRWHIIEFMQYLKQLKLDLNKLE